MKYLSLLLIVLILLALVAPAQAGFWRRRRRRATAANVRTARRRVVTVAPKKRKAGFFRKVIRTAVKLHPVSIVKRAIDKRKSGKAGRKAKRAAKKAARKVRKAKRKEKRKGLFGKIIRTAIKTHPISVAKRAIKQRKSGKAKREEKQGKKKLKKAGCFSSAAQCKAYARKACVSSKKRTTCESVHRSICQQGKSTGLPANWCNVNADLKVQACQKSCKGTDSVCVDNCLAEMHKRVCLGVCPGQSKTKAEVTARPEQPITRPAEPSSCFDSSSECALLAAKACAKAKVGAPQCVAVHKQLCTRGSTKGINSNFCKLSSKQQTQACSKTCGSSSKQLLNVCTQVCVAEARKRICGCRIKEVSNTPIKVVRPIKPPVKPVPKPVVIKKKPSLFKPGRRIRQTIKRATTKPVQVTAAPVSDCTKNCQVYTVSARAKCTFGVCKTTATCSSPNDIGQGGSCAILTTTSKKRRIQSDPRYKAEDRTNAFMVADAYHCEIPCLDSTPLEIEARVTCYRAE